MYKIWINDGTTPKPEDDVFYEVSAAGIFIHKKLRYWHAAVPVKGISFLNDSTPWAKVSLPPIPVSITKEAAEFFAWIYQKSQTEVGAMLWLNEEAKTYRLTVPPQIVTHGSIEYKDAHDARLPGEVLIGTIHSHCDMSAFHSGTDTHDEESIDGIHITLGKFKKKTGYKDFDVSAEIALNGARFGLNIPEWLEGIKEDHTIVERNGFAGIFKGKDDNGRFSFASGEPVISENYRPREDWVRQIKVRVTHKKKRHGSPRYF